MLIRTFVNATTVAFVVLFAQRAAAQQTTPSAQARKPVARFTFDGSLEAASGAAKVMAEGEPGYGRGLAGRCLRIGSGSIAKAEIASDRWQLDASADFSVSFWVRTTAPSTLNLLLVGNKPISNLSLQSQKRSGWVFGLTHGTWMWNIGSGKRRLLYSRDNGTRMPLNDGRWHQLAMSFDHSASVVRLFFDGVNRATYNVVDSTGFDFSSDGLLTIGSLVESAVPGVAPEIEDGRKRLQDLVNAFNQLELTALKPSELMDLVIEPKRFAAKRAKDEEASVTAEQSEQLNRLAGRLMANPYTIHQVADFMSVAPLLKVYRLNDDGTIVINEARAREFTHRESLAAADFDIDELAIRGHVLSAEEVAEAYGARFRTRTPSPRHERHKLTAAAFNIHHGGKHETIEEDGWDSRLAIARLIQREKIDVVMMQETYSSGDFIAAELGYYFATTVDWDYLNQGANISVLSRYPIEEVYVPPGSSFMNVAARVAVSDTQDVFVMSNWYGMRNFKEVYEFHADRFAESDRIPILFGGDFNAVPHTDGGRSPASRQLLDAGFRDAFRELYPDSGTHPGVSHRSGRRIDQLYYKGKGLRNVSTTVLSKWPSKFPSDHFLIKSVFELKYKSR